MKEILGDNLEKFLLSRNCEDVAARTYKGKEYEVWSISDKEFEELCNMTEEEYEHICRDLGLVDKDFDMINAWWRYSEGSNLKNWDSYIFNINGQFMHGLLNEHRIQNDGWFQDTYSSLTEYLCEHVGCSLSRNICAVAMDLAKMNGMTMGKLFEVYEG